MNEIELNGVEQGQNGAEIERKSRRRDMLKTVIFIAAVCAAIFVLTFSLRWVVLIKNIPFRIACICVIYFLMIGVVVLTCFLEKTRVRKLGFSRDKLHFQVLIGLAIAAVLSFLLGALPILIGGKEAALFSKAPNTAEVIFDIITNLILIGLWEELVFRGYLQTRATELTKRKYIGVLIAAALFGLFHIINGSWIQVGFTFLIGCVFGFCRAYLKHCSLLSVIIAHGVYNALLVVLGIVLL